jgi:hypothetical protein
LQNKSGESREVAWPILRFKSAARRNEDRAMRAVIALVALLLLAGQGLDPLAPSNAEKANAPAQPAPAGEPVAGSPDPVGNLPANPPAAGSAPIGKVSPAGPATTPAAKTKDPKAKTDTAAAGKPEVLPWEGKPLAPPAAPDPKAAAASPCNGLFEAGCREQKKACAWIGELKQVDGSVVPGRCAPRVKKAQAPAAAKPKPKPKPAADPAAAAAAPTVDGGSASATAAPATEPAAAPASPVTITVNPPANPPSAASADPAAEEGIPVPAQPYRK